jgi:hypothetical protein
MEGLRGIFETDDEGRLALRTLGGLLFGVAMLLIFLRRSSFGDPWGDFVLFLVLLVPCVVLYGSALLGYLSYPEDRATRSGYEEGRATWYPSGRAWQAVYATFGILLVPLVLFQFVELVNGNTDAPLNTAWIFLVTAVAAAAAALIGNVRYGLLLASISLIFSWLGLWEEILSDGLAGDFGTFRGLLMIIAAILLAAGVGWYMVDRERGLPWSSEIVTGAGIAAVLGAGLISFTAFGDVPVTPPTPTVEGDVVETEGGGASPSLFWDAVLLIVSLGLVAYGSWFRARGPVYVGAIGLFLFVLLVGLDLDADVPEGSLLGWPLLLLLLGLAAIAVSAIPGLKLGSFGLDRLKRDGGGPGGPARPGGGAPTEPRPPAGAPPSSGEPPPPPGAPPAG